MDITKLTDEAFLFFWQGSCGYGYLDKGAYPYWSVAAFSPSNFFSQSIGGGACGTCYEIRCVDKGGPHGVRQLSGPLILEAAWGGQDFTTENILYVGLRETFPGVLLPEYHGASKMSPQAMDGSKVESLSAAGRSVQLQGDRVDSIRVLNKLHSGFSTQKGTSTSFSTHMQL
jgi:hypothetical protein